MPETVRTPEQLRKVEEIYHAAMELDPAKRNGFLAIACGGDAVLANEVESLLATAGQLPDLAVILAQPRSAPAQLAPGTSLGPYKIEAPLGFGGMGEVYRAIDARLNRMVAIKVLPAHRAWDPESRKRFEHEAKILSSLNHPNVCGLFDIGRQDGTDFLVMEYVQGETLASHIPALGMPIRDALATARSIAAALAAAHTAGIVHRDLKPANVMVRADGAVKVMDFGLAKALRLSSGDVHPTCTIEQTQAGAVLGTASYMSPEQAEGKAVGARSDIFAFGALLYEMLTGNRAFHGGTLISTISAVLKDTPPPIHGIRHEVEHAFEAVVNRCLSKDCDARYASGVELESALAGIAARPIPSRQHGWKLAGAIAAVLALAGICTWWGVRQSRANWVHNHAIPEINRLRQADQYLPAYQLAMRARQVLSHDAALQMAIDRCCITFHIKSEPPGVRISYRPYLELSATEQFLAQTPALAPIPIAMLRVHLEKPGYEDAEGTLEPGPDPFFLLDVKGTRPAGMISVPARSQTFDGRRLSLPAFWLDKYEVSNKQFKQFLDQGGYRKHEYWKFPFRKDAQEIPWERAIQLLVDGTGRPGPSTWELGSFPQGQGAYPVGGVSWYEAAAYAEWAGKSLPTVAHWQTAAGFGQISDILKLSNFGNGGPAPVGKFAGLGPFGTYDMAGNLKEWCYNLFGEARAILGGSWDEASYRFRDFDARNPMERQPGYGFRCARFREQAPYAAFAPIRQPDRDPSKETPAGDATFRTWKNSYAYDHAPLDAKVDSVNDSSEYYREEKVSFAAAYGGERVQARIFLPRSFSPPFQTVVYYPTAAANVMHSSKGLGDERQFQFLMRSGRALIHPIYQGTYERISELPPGPNAYRTRVIQRFQDLQRTIDYLETRKEIDIGKLAFYGISMGCHEGMVPVSMEPRFQTAVMAYCGIPPTRQPDGLDALDLAPRIKIPVLLLEARDEFYFPYSTSTLPLFHLLGSPEKDKKLVLREGGHILAFPPETFREILSWLDHHLGAVK